MLVRNVINGILTFIPGFSKLKAARTGGTDSARYCYSVWLRHLVMAHRNGYLTHPLTVAELGPGDSIGVGLAALISGSNLYFGFDVVNYTSLQKNLSIFEELVSLFESRANIPGPEEFPAVKPYLVSRN